MAWTASRYHDISCGHRVHNHESKCAHLHGHNYRIHLDCQAKKGLDSLGRVINFGEIKSRMCMWLEEQWDHKMLIWACDPMLQALKALDASVVSVPFNPTAENIAQHLVEVIGPQQFEGTDIELVKCTIEETRKCSASYEAEEPQ